MNFSFITANSSILAGKPIIKGSRISVELILEWLAFGATIEEITKSFPQLSKEAIQEAILYASRFLYNEAEISVDKVS